MLGSGTLPPVINGSVPDVLIVDEATRHHLGALESLNWCAGSRHSAHFFRHLGRFPDAVRALVCAGDSGVRQPEALQSALTRLVQARQAIG